MRTERVTGTRTPLMDCSNTKSGNHPRGLDEIAGDGLLWTTNPFAPESDISELDSASTAIIETFSSSNPTSYVIKRSAHVESTTKQRPAPIYKDKQHEEYWAFLKAVPEIQPNQLPPLSRCPSLMSGGTLSSRNSSTRSTRSSIWDPIEDHKTSSGSECRVSRCNDISIPLMSTNVQSVQAAEQPGLTCPVKLCSKRFTRAIDRKRHIFRHFTGVLRCGFCTEDEVLFSQSSDRVGLFLVHLLKKHGAQEQSCDTGSDGEQVMNKLAAQRKSRRTLGIIDPVATCSVCTEPFTAQGFYEHLRGCIFRDITRSDVSQTNLDADEFSGVRKASVLSTGKPNGHALSTKREELGDSFEYASYLSPLEPSLEIDETKCEDVAELTVSSRCLSLTSSKAIESSEEETDWTEEQTSRESSPGNSQLPRRLSPAKRRVVETIMQEFQRLFSQSLRSHPTSGHGSSSSNGGNSGWSSNASIYSTSSFASRKRSLSGSGSIPPNEDEDSNKRRRPDSKVDGKRLMGDLRFACPYYKRNPGRHQTFTSCRDPGFTTVARLKEHLYRRHLLPPQCHRCCTTFSNDATLREHQRDQRGCDVREQVPLEGFDKEQERRLKSKKKSQVYQTEDEKWKGVYRILFPDDGETDIPTPYIEYQPCTGQTAEPSNVVRFQEFSRLELPRLVRRTLEAVVEQEAQPLENKMKERLVDIVKECQSRLLSMFQAVNRPSVNAGDLFNDIVPIEPTTSSPSTTPSKRATLEGPGDIFGDFDSLPKRETSSTQTSLLANLSQPIPALMLTTSSNSSDSGYDSTWLATQNPGANANPSSMDFPFPTELNQHEFGNLDGCFDLFENRTDNSGRDPGLMMSADPCNWSFIEPIMGMDGVDAAVQGNAAGSDSSWHL